MRGGAAGGQVGEVIVPLCCSTICFVGSPRPMPKDLVLNSGSKMRGGISIRDAEAAILEMVISAMSVAAVATRMRRFAHSVPLSTRACAHCR